MRRAFIAFLPAVFGAYVLGCVLATQVILARIETLGVTVDLRDRLYATGHDIVGMLTSYLPLMLIAFLLAMPVAAWLGRLLPRLRFALFGLAGAAAVIALHLIMKQVLGLNGIAAVRDQHGLLLQGLAGWFGGYLFFLFLGHAHKDVEQADLFIN